MGSNYFPETLRQYLSMKTSFHRKVTKRRKLVICNKSLLKKKKIKIFKTVASRPCYISQVEANSEPMFSQKLETWFLALASPVGQGIVIYSPNSLY